jgi:gamma-carbonic anhydrase
MSGSIPAPMIVAYKGKAPVVAADAFVAPGTVLVGDVEIASQASIWYGCILRGDVNSIRIGARSNLQDATIVHVSPGRFPTSIGSGVLVGHGALLHACTLMDGSFVGMRSVLLTGVVVETGAMIAAGSLVTEGTRVPAGELWGGSPARKLRDMTAELAQGMQDATREYVTLAREHAEAPSHWLLPRRR